MVSSHIGPIVIGARLGLGLVTPFVVAMRLIGYAHALFTAGHGVLTPLATSLHAREQHQQQQRLFLDGSRYCLALSLFLTACLIFLGRSFIVLWMGTGLADSHRLLIVMALGEVLPLSQGVSASLILATGRHRGMALVALLDNGLILSLAFVLMNFLGLLGVCLALAFSGFLCRGVIRLVLACRCGGVTVRAYLRRALVPAVIGGALPTIGLALATRWREPQSWAELIGAGLLFGIAFLLSCFFVFPEGRPVLGQVGRRLHHWTGLPGAAWGATNADSHDRGKL